MQRRSVLLGSLVALAPLPALAQDHSGCVRRADWNASGPPQGREPSDPSALDAEARRHVPVLALPLRVRAGRPFDLVVQVGVEPHVMTDEHFIDWIEVFAGTDRVLAADLSPRIAFPVVRTALVLAAPAMLVVRAHCNLHGAWITRREIAIQAD